MRWPNPRSFRGGPAGICAILGRSLTSPARIIRPDRRRAVTRPHHVEPSAAAASPTTDAPASQPTPAPAEVPARPPAPDAAAPAADWDSLGATRVMAAPEAEPDTALVAGTPTSVDPASGKKQRIASRLGDFRLIRKLGK